VTDSYVYNLFQSVVVGSGPSTPVWGGGVAVTVNLIALASSKNAGTIVISWWGDDGVTHTASVVPGAPVLIKRQSLRELMISGTAGDVITIVLSWPEETDPSSLVVAGPVSITGTVQTDVGQGTATVGQVVLSEPLGTAYDARQIRALSYSTDLVKVYGSSGLPVAQDSSGNTIQKTAGNQTVIDTAGTVDSIGSGTSAWTTILTGSASLPIGTLVCYTLGVVGALSSAGKYAMIAIVGATSGQYYAICGPGAIAGEFTMARTGGGEKLEAQVINTDTVAHEAYVTWQATAP
jgi:hypothetical protein